MTQKKGDVIDELSDLYIEVGWQSNAVYEVGKKKTWLKNVNNNQCYYCKTIATPYLEVNDNGKNKDGGQKVHQVW